MYLTFNEIFFETQSTDNVFKLSSYTNLQNTTPSEISIEKELLSTISTIKLTHLQKKLWTKNTTTDNRSQLFLSMEQKRNLNN